jgi:NTE family protein
VVTALVFSAGGLYGAWQAGVWNGLYRSVQPDMVLGASAGAWNAWVIAGGATADDLDREWRDPAIGGILQFGPHRAGLLRPATLYAKARELFDRYRPRVPFGMPLVEVPSLRVRLVREHEVTWRHLAAAVSILTAYPPVAIDGRSYVDGGLRSSLPLWAADEMGATRAIAVNCLTAWPFRALRAVVRPRLPSSSLCVTLIEPSGSLGSLRDALVWSPTNIERWIAQGERDANRAMSSVRM